MKKYKFFLLILLLGFIFIPKNVFASTSNNWGGYIVTQTVDGVSTDYNFSGNTFTWDTNGVTYRYGSGSPFPNLSNASTSDMFVIHNGSSSPIYSTKGVNFWLNQPCKGNDSMTFNFDILFGLKDKYGNLNPKDLLNPTFSTTCSSSWKSNNLLHVTCSVPGDSYIGTAVLFNSIVPKNQSYIYTIGIQNNISYTCQVGANSIITNNNINTDKIIDNQNKNQQQTNQKLDKLDQNITSEQGPNLDGLDNSAGWLPAGPVDSILNLPLSFFENLTDNLSKTCQPVSMIFPFTNTNFQLPCISTLYEKIGIMDFLNWLGVIVGSIILYKYFISLYKWVDDTLTFRENNHNDWGGV